MHIIFAMKILLKTKTIKIHALMKYKFNLIEQKLKSP